MKQSDLQKIRQAAQNVRGGKSARQPDDTTVRVDQGEVVIRADAVFLGAGYPRRLRVVCFEHPAGKSPTRS